MIKEPKIHYSIAFLDYIYHQIDGIEEGLGSSLVQGQMFGFARCIDELGNEHFLKAFSGQFLGEHCKEGFVVPLYDPIVFDRLLAIEDEVIHRLTSLIESSIEPESESCQNLKKERAARSKESMKRLFALYSFSCIDGKVRNLVESIHSGINSGEGGGQARQSLPFPPATLPPTGTGDCCAPKLYNAAFRNRWQVAELAEVYLGNDNRSERCPGSFYLPCRQKCSHILPIMLGLDILYADLHIIVLNKPAGLLAVPGKGVDGVDNVVSRLKRLYPTIIDQPSVHRLDMDTSGLMVYAKTKEAHRHISKQFIDGTVKKRYQALLDAVIKQTQGKIALSFRLDPENRPHQIYDEQNGKLGTTHWKRIQVERNEACQSQNEFVTRIDFLPLTGRTHQLRLHSSHEKGLNAPIVGDRLYGSRANTPNARMCLHAYFLEFQHPVTNEIISFTSEIPF